MHQQIAKIRRAYFGMEDHGLLVCFLDFDFGGSGQGTGGHCLDEPIRDEDGKFIAREGTAYGMQFLAAVMRAAGVDSWDKVEGRTVYALRDRDGWGGQIVGIAPLPTGTGRAIHLRRPPGQALLRAGRSVTTCNTGKADGTTLGVR